MDHDALLRGADRVCFALCLLLFHVMLLAHVFAVALVLFRGSAHRDVGCFALMRVAAEEGPFWCTWHG